MQNRSNVWSALCIVTGLAACGSDQTGTDTNNAASINPSAGAAGQASAAAPTNTAAAPVGAAATPATGAVNTGAATPSTGATATPSTGAAAAPTAGTTPTTAVPGAGATPPATDPTAAAPGAPAAGTADPADPNAWPDKRGTCGINSGYAGDEACLPVPDPEVGMQIHIGPKDYTNMAEVAPYLMQPGQESSECWTFHTPNTKDVYYQTYELSGRAGTHHVINTMYNTELADGGFTVCADPGTGTSGNIIDNLPGASKAWMPRGTVAPENADLGRKIPPGVAAQADMHYYNFTDKPILREIWMNIFYIDQSQVKRQADQIRAMGGISWTLAPIPPGADEVYKYECPLSGSGEILSLLGHYHAHGKHFTASIRRAAGGMVEKVFEMYDFMDPAQFEYNSVSKNPPFSPTAAGAVTGTLKVNAGDVLMWDCHIINDSNVGLTYTNEVKTGEMCNLWGSSYGIAPVNCVMP
jgi:hypothetical protein